MPSRIYFTDYKVYEWRRKHRRVNFCYGCRKLKSDKEFYEHNKTLCKNCMSIVRMQNYGKNINEKRYQPIRTDYQLRKELFSRLSKSQV